MKKTPYILYLLLLLLAGCSSGDDTIGGDTPEKHTDSQLVFQVDVNDMTRGEAIAGTSAFATTGRKFRVWGWMSKEGGVPVQMDADRNHGTLYGVDVTYSSGAWTTAYAYYWPREEYSCDFYAAYPTNAQFNTTNKTFDYSSTAVSGDDDLMYATYSDSRTAADVEAGYKTVPLTFHHALSQVGFNMTTSVSGWTLTVNSVALHNVYRNGTMAIPAGTWNLTGATTAGTVSLTTAANATTPLMMIPQQRDGWDNNNTIAENDALSNAGSYITLECALYDSSAGRYFLGSGSDATTVTGYTTVYCPIAPNWVASRKYSYTLEFKEASYQHKAYNEQGYPIYQTLAVEISELVIDDWTTGTPGSVTVE